MMGKLTVPDALAEVERDRWQCETCTAPAEENGRYCLSCCLYWNDVANGLWDDDPLSRLALSGDTND